MNSGPWVKAGPLLAFVDKVLLERLTLLSLHMVMAAFTITLAELGGCYRDLVFTIRPFTENVCWPLV